jgi:hypothetical protein
MVAVADLVGSALLVAVRVTVAEDVRLFGAVYVTEVMLDAESVPTPEPMLQVTPALVGSFVTVGVKTWATPPASVTGVGLTERVMAGAAETVMVAEPDLVGSALLVAVRVTVAAEVRPVGPV